MSQTMPISHMASAFVSPVPSIIKVCSVRIVFICVGMRPFNLAFRDKRSSRRTWRLPNSVGIIPFSSLDPTRKTSRLISSPRRDGILPPSLLDSKSNVRRDSSMSSSDGITPDRLFATSEMERTRPISSQDSTGTCEMGLSSRPHSQTEVVTSRKLYWSNQNPMFILKEERTRTYRSLISSSSVCNVIHSSQATNQSKAPISSV
mmetsp:Transcript_21390/g.59469  ORF Transcript_21390/g.59469 Transcript_21390/m.59469 type:complete len:204 (+) Transcript_21390:138-749(+)